MDDALLAILRSISEAKRNRPCEASEISEQTTSSRRGEDYTAPAGVASVIAPAHWVGGAVGIGETPFEMPCPERRGLVERRGGVFLHFCVECGRWGAYGYGTTSETGQDSGTAACIVWPNSTTLRI
jgi:hypothetical protein